MMKSAICATKMIHGLENTVPFEVGFDESAGSNSPPGLQHVHRDFEGLQVQIWDFT
jgi:hypothetical protein